MSEQLPIGAYVELKAGFDDVYAEATSGSRGTIRDRRSDKYGFKEIYVEWDKEHWRYHGEADGWTYENHFKPVARPDESLLDTDVPAPNAPEVCPDCGGIHPDDDFQERAEVYFDFLGEALEEAADGEAFLVVTVKRERDENGQTRLTPVIMAASLDDEATAMIEAHLVNLAALAHQNFSEALIRNLQRKRNDP